jgi:hypothetical protein
MVNLWEVPMNPSGQIRRHPVIIGLCLVVGITTAILFFRNYTVSCLRSSDGLVYVLSNKKKDSYASVETRTYFFPNGDRFTQVRTTFRKPGGSRRARLSYQGADGTFRCYDEAASAWVTGPLEGRLPRALLFITIDGRDLILCPPLAYYARAAGSLEASPSNDGLVTASRSERGFELTLPVHYFEGGFTEYWVLESKARLIDWANPVIESLWSRYGFTGEHRWCFDGYYFVTPASYVPSGNNYYWRLPAAYITRGLVKSAGSRAADDLGLAMLDILSRNMNESGFFPTLPQSKWLKDEYGMAGGFFDTRFNCDVGESYVTGYNRYGVKSFLDTAVSLGDFFTGMASRNHYAFSGGEGSEGWLIPDYWHPSGSDPVHASLNHQVQEMVFLYNLEGATGDTKYGDLADKILTGIKLTRDRWMMDNGNLEYAYMPDGTMGLTDYPYLTYNDLYNLQALLLQRYGAVDADIQMLMDSKRQWMDANGVTEYTNSRGGT